MAVTPCLDIDCGKWCSPGQQHQAAQAGKSGEREARAEGSSSSSGSVVYAKVTDGLGAVRALYASLQARMLLSKTLIEQ